MVVVKSIGVLGFRLGVLSSSNNGLIAKMKTQVTIWNINSFGEFYMEIFEKYHIVYINAFEQFKTERKLFYEELMSIPNLEVFPSQANYFLYRVKHCF